MPEITAMPILPSMAPPVSSLSVSNGTLGRADKAANPVQAVNAASSNAEPGAASNNDDKSFAGILQRQLAQAMSAPTDTTVVIDTNLKSLQDATVVIDANLKSLQDATVAIDANLKPLQDATVAIDANAQPLSGVALMTAAKESSLPIKSDDEAGQKKSDGDLAAQSPYLLALAANPSVKLDSNTTNLPVAEKKQTAADAGALPQATATLVQSPQLDTKDALPAKPSELPQATANKTAEFAAGPSPLADAAPIHVKQSESAGAESSFENFLAAQAAGRNMGAHAPSHDYPALPVQTPVGARGWDGEVSDKLVWMVGRQEQRAELVLNPPQLGRVEISLSMSGGQTNAMFVSSNPAVRDALEAALPRLREILADAGVSLGQAQVGADAGTNQSANQSTNQRENWDNPRRAASKFDLANGGDLLRPVETTQWLRQANSLVDVFA